MLASGERFQDFPRCIVVLIPTKAKKRARIPRDFVEEK